VQGRPALAIDFGFMAAHTDDSCCCRDPLFDSGWGRSRTR
jgi:hypothetical protein